MYGQAAMEAHVHSNAVDHSHMSGVQDSVSHLTNASISPVCVWCSPPSNRWQCLPFLPFSFSVFVSSSWFHHIVHSFCVSLYLFACFSCKLCKLILPPSKVKPSFTRPTPPSTWVVKQVKEQIYTVRGKNHSSATLTAQKYAWIWSDLIDLVLEFHGCG